MREESNAPPHTAASTTLLKRTYRRSPSYWRSEEPSCDWPAPEKGFCEGNGCFSGVAVMRRERQGEARAIPAGPALNHGPRVFPHSLFVFPPPYKRGLMKLICAGHRLQSQSGPGCLDTGAGARLASAARRSIDRCLTAEGEPSFSERFALAGALPGTADSQAKVKGAARPAEQIAEAVKARSNSRRPLRAEGRLTDSGSRSVWKSTVDDDAMEA
ncbi:hypothetical protein SKAU_G00310590 [Synaphobranchus kaupii]|uniref:Uncharacterized protein n=1 Tax=Synaphobranchus kaupii TaxID=118154 RepID=A0A9Q1ERK8_SYNKA|nr:hypothetical protein SKAU_G00310590 [Synaphobranchus kaupii]